MTQTEMIEAIKALTEVVKVNGQWFGRDTDLIIKQANDKIIGLIKTLDS